MQIFYYSMKVGNKEYCVEPLLFGQYHLAIYDHEQSLIDEKEKVDALEAVSWMFQQQNIHNEKFKKMAITEEMPPEDLQRRHRIIK